MQAKYFFQLIALSALWGASFMLTRISSLALGADLAAGLRMSLAAVVLCAIMRALRQPWPLQYWRELLLLGFLGVAGPHVLYAHSARGMPAGYGALLSVTSVLFSAFASAMLKEQPLTHRTLLGCIIGMVGAALVVKLGPVQPTPELIISSLLCVAGSGIAGIAAPLLKRATARMEPLAITAGMHASAVLLMLPGALLDIPDAHFTLKALGAVSLMGIATSGLAYWMFMRIMKHIPPLAAMSSAFMCTGFGVLWAVVFLGEETSPAMYAGGVLILLACLLVFGLNPLTFKARLIAGKE